MTTKEKQVIINWTPLKLKRFKELHALAVREKKDSFDYDGHEFIVSYAKYLIEYLDSEFAR